MIQHCNLEADGSNDIFYQNKSRQKYLPRLCNQSNTGEVKTGSHKKKLNYKRIRLNRLKQCGVAKLAMLSFPVIFAYFQQQHVKSFESNV